MLAKENRLQKEKDFERVFKQGKGFKQDFLFLKKVENDLEETRFGFVVSQKISKKAVVRNQVKRRLREIIRNKLKTREIKKGFDVVLIALPGLEQENFQEIEQMINKLLSKARLITNNLTI